jgi:hypothetical protein
MHKHMIWISMTLLASTCLGRELAKEEPDTSGQQHQFIPVELERSFDILFVIDNSGSMAEEQESLAQNFQRFMAVVETSAVNSVHIGVVSTDMGAGGYAIGGCSTRGDEGSLQSQPRSPDCQGPDGAFIQHIVEPSGSITRNYEGELGDVFSCIARLGTDGCGFEQPLESMYRALDGTNPKNAGFLREDAYLLVVFITDEDDCSVFDTRMFDTSQQSMSDPLGPLSSFRCFDFGVQCSPDAPREPGVKESCQSRPDSPYMHDVARYVEFLRSLKPDPAMVMVAAVTGAPGPVEVTLDGDGNAELAPSCQAATGSAVPPVRLRSLLDAFPARNTLESICSEDLSKALISIAQGVLEHMSPCLLGDLYDSDQDSSNGVQPECVVTMVSYPGTDLETHTIIAECDAATADEFCYAIRHDPSTCGDTETQLAMSLVMQSAAPPGARLDVRCRI